MDQFEDIGIDASHVAERAKTDDGIAEFCRFYTERLGQELQAAGGDARKRKKLEDDFTPRLEISLVGLDGSVQRKVTSQVTYGVGSAAEYKSLITFIPSTQVIVEVPELQKNSQTEAMFPSDCLGKCEISANTVFRHQLMKSAISERTALPEYTVVCSLTGKRVLRDEVELSSVTGQLVISSELKTSAASGKRAEPRHFRHCEFTGVEVLDNECARSQVSGKAYRLDEENRSAISGKTGHQQEFIKCAVTEQWLTLSEAEKCELTGKLVMPGVLEQCAVTGKRVLPSELERSVASGKVALKKLFVSSNISGARILEGEAVRSLTGTCCTPDEAKMCLWSGTPCHPEDLRRCEITGLQIHRKYSFVTNGQTRFEPIINLLNGGRRKNDKAELWSIIIEMTADALGRHTKVEAAEFSLTKKVSPFQWRLRIGSVSRLVRQALFFRFRTAVSSATS